LFVEVYADISRHIAPGATSGIKLIITDPNGVELNKYTL